MACEVKTFGNLQDFHKVQEYFGLRHGKRMEDNHYFSTYLLIQAKTKIQNSDDNWLNGINFSISPTGELIAMALGEKLALMSSSSWDTKSQISSYTLSWCGELEDPNQIVTSVLCLPMFGRSVSSGADWTCVALGLSSGMVVFYTDSGIKLYSQR